MHSHSLERRLIVALLFLAGVVAALALPHVAAADCPVQGCPGGGGGGVDPTTYTLTIQIQGVGTVDAGTTELCSVGSGTNLSTKTCTKTYAESSTPTLTATAGSGYGFSGWGGDCSGSSCAPSMDADKTVTVRFVDHSPPPAAIITGPAASPAVVRSDDGASLTFTTNSDTSVTRCAVDSAIPTTCATPWPLPAMADGTHTLRVQSVDVNGNLIEVSRQISYVNVPDTVASGTPAEAAIVNTTTTAFTFPALALCKLDDNAVACSNVSLGAVLGDGAHTLSIAAGVQVNSTGYYDKTPALRHWTIDTDAPDTSLSAGPSSTTTERTATFGFGGADPAPGTAMHYECRLDGAAWAPCDSSSSQQYPNVAAGSHTFDVRAVDAAGNADPSPASRSWTVIVDADGDGYYSNTDCNDSNPAIHPGATDTPGDGIDQDCSGADAQVASGVLGSGPSASGTVLAAKLGSGFKLKGKLTLVRKLTLSGVPARAHVTVRCSGHGCPFRHKSFKPKKGTVNLTGAFKGHKLRKGAKVEIDVSMAGAKTQVFKLSTRAGRKPLLKTA